MMKYKLIENDEDFIEYKKNLYYNDIDKISMDFEGDYNLRHYGKTLCLIQIFDGESYIIIDPFKISNEEMIKFFQLKRPIKYMYSAGGDVELVYDNYKTKLRSVYDIQYLVDVLEINPKGLDKLIENILNIKLNFNKKKYQLFNWFIRPLPAEAIEYALTDTKYLFQLYNELRKRINTDELYDKLIEKFVRMDYDFIARNNKPKIYQSKEYLELQKDEQEKFNIIYQLREKLAEESDIPCNNILTNNIIFEISKDISKIDNIKTSNNTNINEIRNKIKNKILEYAMHDA